MLIGPDALTGPGSAVLRRTTVPSSMFRWSGRSNRVLQSRPTSHRPKAANAKQENARGTRRSRAAHGGSLRKGRDGTDAGACQAFARVLEFPRDFLFGAILTSRKALVFVVKRPCPPQFAMRPWQRARSASWSPIGSRADSTSDNPGARSPSVRARTGSKGLKGRVGARQKTDLQHGPVAGIEGRTCLLARREHGQGERLFAVAPWQAIRLLEHLQERREQPIRCGPRVGTSRPASGWRIRRARSRNKFASAFLMPSADVFATIPGSTI